MRWASVSAHLPGCRSLCWCSGVQLRIRRPFPAARLISFVTRVPNAPASRLRRRYAEIQGYFGVLEIRTYPGGTGNNECPAGEDLIEVTCGGTITTCSGWREHLRPNPPGTVIVPPPPCGGSCGENAHCGVGGECKCDEGYDDPDKDGNCTAACPDGDLNAAIDVAARASLLNTTGYMQGPPMYGGSVSPPCAELWPLTTAIFVRAVTWLRRWLTPASLMKPPLSTWTCRLRRPYRAHQTNAF